eukprot:GHRQ01037645.1.p1 GENE.GHRQ01037645.1~~GHRQ01037645.1.p1  ORF type:complete len:181 (+),score=75.96 GHRQ01037645.1:91-633(+)
MICTFVLPVVFLPRLQAVQPPSLLLYDDEAAAAANDAAACVPGLGPEPVPLNHYLQNLISPRSRSEYDEFNRFHFSRLKQQGRDKRAITPKVGQEPMNRTELAAFQQEMRSPRVSAEVASRARSPEVRGLLALRCHGRPCTGCAGTAAAAAVHQAWPRAAFHLLSWAIAAAAPSNAQRLQ